MMRARNLIAGGIDIIRSFLIRRRPRIPSYHSFRVSLRAAADLFPVVATACVFLLPLFLIIRLLSNLIHGGVAPPTTISDVGNALPPMWCADTALYALLDTRRSTVKRGVRKCADHPIASECMKQSQNPSSSWIFSNKVKISSDFSIDFHSSFVPSGEIGYFSSSFVPQCRRNLCLCGEQSIVQGIN